MLTIRSLHYFKYRVQTPKNAEEIIITFIQVKKKRKISLFYFTVLRYHPPSLITLRYLSHRPPQLRQTPRLRNSANSATPQLRKLRCPGSLIFTLLTLRILI